MFVTGGDDDWPYLLSVYALLVIICLPLLFMLPESPKYLFVVKRNEQTALNGELKVESFSTKAMIAEWENGCFLFARSVAWIFLVALYNEDERP